MVGSFVLWSTDVGLDGSQYAGAYISSIVHAQIHLFVSIMLHHIGSVQNMKYFSTLTLKKVTIVNNMVDEVSKRTFWVWLPRKLFVGPWPVTYDNLRQPFSMCILADLPELTHTESGINTILRALTLSFSEHMSELQDTLGPIYNVLSPQPLIPKRLSSMLAIRLSERSTKTWSCASPSPSNAQALM